MPLIPPQFTSNASSSSPTNNKPPWAKGPVASVNVNNGQQGNEFVAPWRRNLRSVAPPNSNSSQQKQQQNVPVEVPATPNPFQEPQTKTSKLQINLKSVKKPEPAAAVPQQSNFPSTGKVIPILIQKSEPESDKKVAVTRIPIQRQSQNSVTKEGPQSLYQTAPANQALSNSTQQDIPKMPQSSAGGPPPPAPPPPPGGPPPPPPPPTGGAPPKVLKIEQLKKAPKKRPDWAGMMKEIESGRKLNHVECNDRSKPIIPRLKSRGGKFMFESEVKPATKSDAIHNRLINEIQQGVKLKKVQCNDRSKPILSGLRGVRRQSSVMEDGSIPAMLEPVDELAFLDIDVLRDELQSAKQMLQTEVESKHSLERKTRDQKCQIIAMEAEIETMKAKLGLIPEEEVSMLAKNLEKSGSKTFKHLRKSGSALWKSPSIVGLKKSKSGLAKDTQLQLPKTSPSDANINKLDQANEEELTEMDKIEEEMVSLKEAVQHARKQAEEMEAKYKEAMSKLQNVQNSFEDSEQKRKSLEKQVDNLEALQEGKRPIPPVIQTAERTTQTEEQILERTAALSRQQSTATGDADGYESEEESESDLEVDEETVQKKKQERELKLWENKVKSIKDKQNTSRLERRSLKNLQKKLEAELKEANKRHRKLQKEVDKMAKMLNDVEKEDDEEEESEDEKETAEEETEEEESEEEESESGSEEEDDDEDSSEEDDEAAGYDDRLAVFGKRVKRRENVLNALRKGNYLLRANIDRLKDDLEEARITYHDLEHELNAVLDET